MTIEQLIKYLQQYPADTRVYRDGDDYNGDLRILSKLRIITNDGSEAPRGSVVLE